MNKRSIPVKNNVNPGEPLYRYLGHLNKHAIPVRFTDTHGRSAVAILEPKGEPKDPHGYCAMVAVDDGKDCHSLYVGELSYAKPNSVEVVGSVHPFNGAKIAFGGVMTVGDMRVTLVDRAKVMAEDMSFPPLAPAFMADWNGSPL